MIILLIYLTGLFITFFYELENYILDRKNLQKVIFVPILWPFSVPFTFLLFLLIRYNPKIQKYFLNIWSIHKKIRKQQK